MLVGGEGEWHFPMVNEGRGAVSPSPQLQYIDLPPSFPTYRNKKKRGARSPELILTNDGNQDTLGDESVHTEIVHWIDVDH